MGRNGLTYHSGGMPLGRIYDGSGVHNYLSPDQIGSTWHSAGIYSDNEAACEAFGTEATEFGGIALAQFQPELGGPIAVGSFVVGGGKNYYDFRKGNMSGKEFGIRVGFEAAGFLPEVGLPLAVAPVAYDGFRCAASLHYHGNYD